MSQKARTGSRSDYARHIGSSAAYVTKLGKQGRLVEVDVGGRKVVDFDATDRRIVGTTDMGRAANGGNTSRSTWSSSADSRVDTIYRQAQTQERAYNAKLAELEYRKAVGELVRADDVKSAFAKKMALLRDSLLSIPARVSAVVAAESDASKCHEILTSELTASLESIAAGADSAGASEFR